MRSARAPCLARCVWSYAELARTGACPRHPVQFRTRQLKAKILKARATPPMYLACDLKTTALASVLQVKFDVILIDPPLEEYGRQGTGRQTLSALC